MSKPANLTAYARAGYDGNENTHLATSPAWYAHKLGQYLHATGRCVPVDVRMSRGYRVRCGDSVYAFDNANRITRES